MITNALKEMWPVIIDPIIHGLPIVYYSNTETFEYDNTIYHLKLGKKTYKPIYGYLVLSKADLEIMNYKRLKNNLELFSHVTSAVKYILNTREGMEKLIFVASQILDSDVADETKLLKKMGYATIMPYRPRTLEDAQHFLDTFSMYQTQEQRSSCFGLNGGIYFIMLNIMQIAHPENNFVFANQNLAVTPKITETIYTVNYKGEVEAHFKFEPVEILGQKFVNFTKPYGLLEEVTLVDNKLYDLTTKKAPELTHCPCCSWKLANQTCINPTCKEKVIYQACRLASKDFLNIKGLSYSVLRDIYDYLVQSDDLASSKMHDLFFLEMPLDAIDNLDLKKRQGKLLKESLSKAHHNQKLCDIIYSLDVPGIDKREAKNISKIIQGDINKLIYAIEQSNAQNYQYINALKDKLIKLKYYNHYIENIN